MKTIGLIAGNRKFPLLFAEGARRHGYKVIAVGIRRDTLALLEKKVDKFFWVHLSELDRLISIFKEEGVKEIAMAGQVSPARLFSREVIRSPQLQELLKQVKDKRADSIFGALADKLKAAGFNLVDSTLFLKEYMPGVGVLTKRQPTDTEWEDIHFGFNIAKELGRLDIGQSVAVKEKAVVAVEALEGTDNLIRRAGALSRGKVVVVKVSKPKQDKRFDIPVIGLNTIKNLIRAKAVCLGIEAGQTLFIDQVKALALADKCGLAIAAVKNP